MRSAHTTAPERIPGGGQLAKRQEQTSGIALPHLGNSQSDDRTMPIAIGQTTMLPPKPDRLENTKWMVPNLPLGHSWKANAGHFCRAPKHRRQRAFRERTGRASFFGILDLDSVARTSPETNRPLELLFSPQHSHRGAGCHEALLAACEVYPTIALYPVCLGPVST